MVALRSQPQGLVRLDRARDMFAGALGVINAPHIFNLATGVALRTAGTIPKPARVGAQHGVVLPFRQSWYVETEVLPAIGTASFTEFWIGYPSAMTGTPGGSVEPSFVTGSSANKSGICTSVGVYRTATADGSTRSNTTVGTSWGAVVNWGATYYLNSANDVPTVGELTILVVVRRQTGMEFWRNGRMVNFIAGAPVSIPTQSFICGSFIESSSWYSASDTLLAGRVLGEWSADQAQRFTSSLTAAVGMTFAALTDDGDHAAPAASLTLTAEPGAFALAGMAADVRAARRLSVVPGVFAWSGEPVSLATTRRLPAGQGSFSLSGGAARLFVGHVLSAGVGVFALSGSATSLRAARKLPAQSGAFTLSPGSVQMVYTPAAGPGGPTYTLTAVAGAFALTVGAAGLQAHRRMSAASTAFGWSGAAASLLAGRRIPASVGVFAMAGGAATLRAARCVPAQAGTFNLAGADAQLRYSAQVAYARAPAGAGYAPKQHYNEGRPAATGGSRPATLQRNNR